MICKCYKVRFLNKPFDAGKSFCLFLCHHLKTDRKEAAGFLIHLSILDQAPVSKGESPVTTLQHSVELAQFSEEWGYKRYWFAEHHSTKGLASTAPEIMIARIAAQTNTIRVGSGGVLLPQYSSFKVAETFRQLEALYPNRIDLGVGLLPRRHDKNQASINGRGEK